jgi:hypothetical protein
VAIFIAASESSHSEGFVIMLSPAARRAAAMARCVMLFEGGALTDPFISEGTT